MRLKLSVPHVLLCTCTVHLRNAHTHTRQLCYSESGNSALFVLKKNYFCYVAKVTTVIYLSFTVLRARLCCAVRCTQYSMCGAQALFSSLYPLDFSSLFCPPPLSIYGGCKVLFSSSQLPGQKCHGSHWWFRSCCCCCCCRETGIFFFCVCVCVCVFLVGEKRHVFSLFTGWSNIMLLTLAIRVLKKKKKKTRKLFFTKNPLSGLWSLRMINVCRLVGVIYELRDQVFEWLPSFFLVVPFVFIQTANLMSKASFIEWVSDQM